MNPVILPIIMFGCVISWCGASAVMSSEDNLLRIDKKSLNYKGSFINPELVGFNLLYWIDDKTQYENRRLEEEIKQIRPALLRYPAGTASQNYDWRSNTVVNTNLFPFGQKNNLLDTDNYISLIKNTGAGAFVVVDIASAHLKDRKKAVTKGQEGYEVAQPVSVEEEQAMIDKAAAWAESFEASGLSPVCYELGNEHYLAFLDYMVFTPEMYVQKCKRFIKAIRKADPDAQFAICGPDPFSRSHYYYKNTPWWPMVLKELSGDVNRLVLHKYWGPIEAVSAADPGEPYRVFRRDLTEWGRKEGVDIRHLKIGFTEWGGREYMDSQRFGLFSFRLLCGLAENGVDYAIEWPFRWPEQGEFGQAQLVEQETGRPTFAFYVLSAWSRFFSGKYVVNSSKGSCLPSQIKSFAAIDENGVPVIAIANTGAQTATIQLDVEWPKNVQTLQSVDVSASGIETAKAVSPDLVSQVDIGPGKILIIKAN